MKRVFSFSAVLLFLSNCDLRYRDVEHLSVRGSDTEVNLVLALAEEFMEQDAAISIAVTGGGSGAGIAALINGKTDLANSSRPLKQEEIELANERGVYPVATVLAIDALAIVVHQEQAIDRLTLEQVSAVYQGSIRNWQELGGHDQAISLYGRQSNSGTFVYFRDSIVQAEYSESVKQMNGTAQIVEAIRNDRAGIGYVGLGYVLNKEGQTADGVKVLAIETDGEGSISPLIPENILTGTYPLLRPLYQYTDGFPTDKLSEFLRFEWSASGQEIVQKNGYYPLSDRLLRENFQYLTTKNVKSPLH